MKLCTNIKKIIIDVFWVFSGVICIGLGAAFFLLANAGSDPVTVLVDGFHVLLNVSVGMSLTILSFLVIGIMFFIHKKHIGIGTLIAGAFTGWFIDIGCCLLNILPLDSSDIFVKAAMVILGSLVMAFGIALYITPRIGVGFIDLIILTIMDFKKIRYNFVRIALDFTCILVGGFLGGTIGIATLAAMCIVGPFAQIFMNIFQPIIYNIHNRLEKA